MGNNYNDSDTGQQPLRPVYSIEKITTEEEFTALRDEWNRLTDAMPDCSLFLSWDWLNTWWHDLSADYELWLLTARDMNGRLAGIAPWMRNRAKLGLLSFNRLSFIGSGLARPSHLDIMAQPGEDKTVSAAFLQFLHDNRKEWDVLDLEGLQQDSSLELHLSGSAGKCVWRDPVCSSFVLLPSSWETFQKKYMNAKLRKTIRYYERRLKKYSPDNVVFQSVLTEVDLNAAIEFLVRNSRRLFQVKGLTSCFENSAFSRFFQNIAHNELKKDGLRFYQLKVNDQIIAVQCCFRFKDIVYGYQTAFDPDWGKYSPGQQLLAYVFQEAIREKSKKVDMMHGESDYKSSWASGTRQDSNLLYALKLPGKFWLYRVILFTWVISLGRKIIPDKTRLKINRYLARKP